MSHDDTEQNQRVHRINRSNVYGDINIKLDD